MAEKRETVWIGRHPVLSAFVEMKMVGGRLCWRERHMEGSSVRELWVPLPTVEEWEHAKDPR